ncbi:hypothetical protein Acr_00g0070510 [Actinidia rufa]|uniref:Uncharacterized protein n=1 Tax=Actinidia rufa TaxID=165716 RepID=A0A7J0DRA3_9ERIC|nr:hypothetical protein Acr_00g0070510 [Actinidia rufa]
MVRTKHASNDSRGDDPIPTELDMEFSGQVRVKDVSDGCSRMEQPSTPSKGRIHKLGKGFSITTIKKGISFSSTEDKGDEGDEEVDSDEEISYCVMDIENLEIPPSIRWQDEEILHGENPIRDEFPMEGDALMHRAYPSQEVTSTQGGPPLWFLEYFGELKEPMVRIKQHQDEIIHTQQRHEEYPDRLRDIYNEQGQQINRLGDLYEKQG